MASRGTTNLFKEKKILQEEEKSLKLMLEKFQDQLNRLKIKELALSHLLRMQQSKEKKNEKEGSSKTSADAQSSAERRNLDASTSNMFSDSEEENESQLSDMVPVGFRETFTQKEEDANDINRQVLDLNVPHSSGGVSGRSPVFAGSAYKFLARIFTPDAPPDATELSSEVVKEDGRNGVSHKMEGNTEEMEEEEEEFDSDDMDEEPAEAEDSVDPLRSFMDEL